MSFERLCAHELQGTLQPPCSFIANHGEGGTRKVGVDILVFRCNSHFGKSFGSCFTWNPYIQSTGDRTQLAHETEVNLRRLHEEKVL